MKIFLAIIQLMLLILPRLAFSQFSLEGGINTGVNNNINNNYEQLRDNVSTVFADMYYDIDFKNTGISLYYNGSFNYYHKYVNRSFHGHTAGLMYQRDISQDWSHGYETGVEFSKLFNRADYSYLDNSVLSAYGSYENYLGKRVKGNLEYNLNINLFDEYDDLNNIQNHFSAGITGFLPSKTTLGFSAGFGVKTFLNSVMSSSGGMRKGKRGNSGSTGESILRADITGSLSQSLFKKTGLNVEAGYGKTFNSGSRYILSGNDLDYNDMFDDEYNYDGPQFNVTLTQYFPWNITLSVSAGYSELIFVNRPAYNLNEIIVSDTRKDKVLSFDFMFEKEFKNFGFSFVYSYEKRTSNDLFYNSMNNVISLKLSMGF